jgi:hypothetical protein
VLQLCGLAILIAGALSYANIDKIDNHLQNVDVSGSPIALIVVGSIVFIIAFYGCCGAIRESHCMVVTVRTQYYATNTVCILIRYVPKNQFLFLGGQMNPLEVTADPVVYSEKYIFTRVGGL